LWISLFVASALISLPSIVVFVDCSVERAVIFTQTARCDQRVLIVRVIIMVFFSLSCRLSVCTTGYNYSFLLPKNDDVCS
jgi:hypothetical protein